MTKTLMAALLLGTTTLAGCMVTPKAMNEAEIARIAYDRVGEITSAQAPITGSVSLEEAIARALKYNLEHRVEMAKVAVENGTARLKSFDMLPNAVVRTGYAGRNNFSGSFSRNLVTGTRSTQASTSSTRGSITADLTLSWNILDFGLSYIRAQQQADKVLIAEEMRRRVANKVVEDVRSAYWRAVSSDRLQRKLKWLEGKVNRALTNSKRQYRAGVTAPVTSLTYQRELLDIKKQLQELHRELHIAKVDLARLMNIKPTQNYGLIVPKKFPKLPKLTADYDEMVGLALMNRPEIREIGYRQRINGKEANASLLQILPSLEGYLGGNFDTNNLLLTNNWVTYGARASWNVLKIFSLPARQEVNRGNTEMLRRQALATSVAIMAQVAVARIRYSHLRSEMRTSNQYYHTQAELLRQVRAQARAQIGGEQAVIREEMETILAAVRRDVLHADLQNAMASLYWTVGVDPYPENLTGDESLGDLTASLKSFVHGSFQPLLVIASN